MNVISKDISGKKVDIAAVKRAARKVLARTGKSWTVGIFFVKKKEIKALNRKFRHKDRPTDVLSFDMKENGYLGDVIISPEVARGNARKYGSVYTDEIIKLVVHGVLHLLGYDHGTARDRERMFRLQEKLTGEV